jgi:hypothetical protein
MSTGTPVRAQETPAAAADSSQNSALRAFLDCDERGCDRDFLVSEMKWINWMRDRLDADFHILVTSQTTGSDGNTPWSRSGSARSRARPTRSRSPPTPTTPTTSSAGS